MKKTDTAFNMLDAIDEKHIEEAVNYKKKEKKISFSLAGWQKGLVAACLALAITLGVLAMPSIIKPVVADEPTPTAKEVVISEESNDSEAESDLIETIWKYFKSIYGNSISKETYNKIAFDVSSVEYEEISNENELNSAIERISKDQNTLEETLSVTVIMKSNFMNEDKYKLLTEKIEKAENEEEEDKCTEEFLKYADEYHNELFEMNKNLFDDINYKKIHLAGGSPFVTMIVPKSEIKKDWLIALAKNEKIGYISISEIYEAIDSDLDLSGLSQEDIQELGEFYKQRKSPRLP